MYKSMFRRMERGGSGGIVRKYATSMTSRICINGHTQLKSLNLSLISLGLFALKRRGQQAGEISLRPSRHADKESKYIRFTDTHVRARLKASGTGKPVTDELLPRQHGQVSDLDGVRKSD